MSVDADTRRESAIRFRHRLIDSGGPENPHVKASGDIDGDGLTDVVVASSKGGPLVWYRAPEWTRHVVAPSGKWSCTARLVDMDGDGDLDILIPEWYTHDRLEWYENPLPGGDPTAGPWKRHIIGPPRAHDIRVGDIDGDGVAEIVTRTQGADGDHVVVRKPAAGGGWAASSFPCPAGEGLALGDVDGDGTPEIVIGGRWYKAAGDVLADPWTEHVLAEWPPDSVAEVADINADGRLEVVLTRSEGPHRVSWFEASADPGGLWREHVVDDSVDFAHGVVVADIDGDGTPDIAVAEMHQSARRRVMVYLNEGRGERWRRRVLAETGSHNICAVYGAGGRFAAVVGANWSGAHQPVEMWELQER